MGPIASQITSLTIVYSTVYSDADQWKYQSSASLAFVRGIHRGPVNSPHKTASNAEDVSIWWRHHDICVSKLGHHWFKQRAVAYSVPIYCLNQYWLVVNRTLQKTFQWKINRHTANLVQVNKSESIVCIIAAIALQPKFVKWHIRMCYSFITEFQNYVFSVRNGVQLKKDKFLFSSHSTPRVRPDFKCPSS